MFFWTDGFTLYFHSIYYCSRARRELNLESGAVASSRPVRRRRLVATRAAPSPRRRDASIRGSTNRGGEHAGGGRH